MNQEPTFDPKKYWKDADGAYRPVDKIKPIDKDRHYTVTAIVEQAKQVSADMLAFKLTAMAGINEFVDRSLSEYKIQVGGAKGNISLISFDGKYKIVRQMQDSIVFDERLAAAKILLDQCIMGWSKGSNDNLKVLVNKVFQVNREGKISTGRVLELRQYDIKDEKWLLAMKAINDSIKVVASKSYIRFYERFEETGEYLPINLDVAKI
jgi:hypothetical protein